MNKSPTSASFWKWAPCMFCVKSPDKTLQTVHLSRLGEKPRMARYENDCLEMWRHRANLSRGAARRDGLEADGKKQE
jgi:hypothetical protein